MLPNIGLMMLNQQNKTLLIIEYIGLYPSLSRCCPTDEINKTLYSVKFFMLAQR